MPDTKSGRERSGRNKRRQLEDHLAQREIDALEADDTPPELAGEVESEYLAESDEIPDRRSDD